MKHYERLATTPLEVAPEERILAASGEKTTCRIDPVNVEVTPFVEDGLSKTFDLSLE